MEAELSARAVALLHRGLREVLAILVAVVAILMLLALMTFHVSDPSWSHTGGSGQIRNACGIFGAWFADVAMFLFGYIAYLLPVGLAVIGWKAFRDSREFTAPLLVFARIAGMVLLLITACGLGDLHFFVHRGDLPIGTDGGGVLGAWVAGNMVGVINTLGTTLILCALFLGSITFITGASWFAIVEETGRYTLKGFRLAQFYLLDAATRFQEYLTYREARQMRRRQQLESELAANQPEREDPEVKEPLVKNPRKRVLDSSTDSSPENAASDSVADDAAAKDATVAVAAAATETQQPRKISISQRPANPAPVAPESESDKQFQLFETPKSTAKRAPGEIPPVNLLDKIESMQKGYSEENLEHLSRLLESKLAEFNVVIEVVAVHPGPVITRFEALPAPGVKVSKITGLSKDIARSLSVMSVRVVEVIPGKPTIGLEIPNEDREIVQLTEILQSKVYQQTKSPLAIALGKDISGLPVVTDLAKMPHLLVAGTTGSGKSVAVNAMLISLLYKATADQVRLILIDPKMLELNVYEGIPHLLAPVVTDMKEAANALRWCVGEMERRYRLMASLGVRNISGFNKKVTDAIAAGEPIKDPLYKPEEAFDPSLPPPDLETLPFIVVVVDEFADMMMVVGKKVEELIARIAQKARAAGIHLVLATQRPSVDVITGLIKANIPTRMAFQVSSRIDSRTIIDQGGAETLLGHGDMLFLPPGTALPERVHGAFVDDHEVHSVVDWLKESGTAVYIDEILQESTLPLPGLASEGGEEDGERDALYDQAVAIVTESRKASISYVQRRLKIGYNRAARIVEDMEAAGVVSAVQHNGSREVIAPPPV
ncbi:cell division protein FtsK [Chromatiales bacterium (ex Bugula neritina AB1)]|nr:cell division protein FtsK [Chromatiales bacterium (ex Bugula neritina AB1)]